MSIFIAILIFLIVAIIFTIVFFGLVGSRGPWGSIWTVLITIFLFIWAASLWLQPIGPVYYGVAWIPIVFVGFLVAFLLIAASPPHYRGRPRFKISRDEKPPERERDPAAYAALDIFFWLVAGILIVAIVTNYLLN